MNTSRFGLAVLVIVCGALPAWAADLTKIDRTIAKEPAYQTATQKYCLLVFGPEAKTRVWLVLDGDVLYVDRNGNGDLTEPDKRVRKTGGYEINAGSITEADGTSTRGVLTVSPTTNYVRLYLEVSGGCKQYVGYDPSDRLAFADRPQNAPIVHFAGPLTLRLYRQPPVFVAGQNCRFNIALGTPGIGKGSFVAVSCCSLPDAVKPLAYVEFPHRDPNEAPLRVEYVLDGD